MREQVCDGVGLEGGWLGHVGPQDLGIDAVKNVGGVLISGELVMDGDGNGLPSEDFFQKRYDFWDIKGTSME